MKSINQLLWLISLWGISLLATTTQAWANDCANAIPLVVSPTCQITNFGWSNQIQNYDGLPPNSGLIGGDQISGIYTCQWFRFTAISTDMNIEMNITQPNAAWTGAAFEVLTGACGALQPITVEYVRYINTQQYLTVARGLVVGTTYYLVMGNDSYRGASNICLTPTAPSFPRLMISTRKGGNWYDPTTWLAGRTPAAGDTIIINDSSTVTCNGGSSFQSNLLTVGRGITTHGAKLILSDGGITNNVKFTVLRPQDLVGGTLIIKGNLEFNGNMQPSVLGEQTILKYRGTGTRLVTRSALVPPMDSLNIHTVMQCKTCTTTINFPWIACGGLYLDSGYFNPTVAFVHAIRGYSQYPYYVTLTHQIRDGHYIGVPASGSLSKLLVLYPRLQMPSIKRKFAGKEWPNTNTLYGVSAENIDSLVGNPNLKIGELKYLHTHIAAGVDSIIINNGDFYTSAQDLDTMTLGSIGVKVIKLFFNRGAVSIGKQRNFRTLKIDDTDIRNFSRSSVRIEYFDQKPAGPNPSTVAPLSRLIGRHYIRISQAGRPTDSLNLTFYRNVNDSIRIYRNDLVMAQAPHPTGPWKMVGVRDSLIANRNVRKAKVTLADGEYFTWGSLDRPYEAELRFMNWPAYYRMGCSNSIGLPLRYIVRNTGMFPLDSLEYGFRTDLEYRTQWVRLRKPLQPYTDDTLVLEGPQGANMTAAQTYNTAAWISHPGFQNRGDDTSYQVLNAAPQPLPWNDNIDSYVGNTALNQYNSRNRLPLVKGWEFDYSTPRIPIYSFNSGSTNNSLLSTTNRANFGIVMSPIQVNAGRIYTYERVFTDAALPARDTIYMQYTLDCGATWTTYHKHKLGDVTGVANFVERKDSIDIPQAGAIAFKIWRPQVSAFARRVILDAFTVSTLATSLPALQSQAPSQYWYPNPTTGLIKFTGKAEQLVSVFNMMGHLVLQRKIQPDQSIDLSAQPPGLYLIKGPEGTSRVVRE
jgi:hypothetical protein